jgi:hypothetical protein
MHSAEAKTTGKGHLGNNMIMKMSDHGCLDWNAARIRDSQLPCKLRRRRLFGNLQKRDSKDLKTEFQD